MGKNEEEKGKECCCIILHILEVCFNKFVAIIFMNEYVMHRLFLDKTDAFDCPFFLSIL